MIIFFINIIRQHPKSTLFPYTTLFRSPLIPEPVQVLAGNLLKSQAQVLRFCVAELMLREINIQRSEESTITYIMPQQDRKSTRLNSSHGYISYAVFCLKKKNKNTYNK